MSALNATAVEPTYQSQQLLAGRRLPRLAVRLVFAAIRAELLQLQPVRVVAAVLFGDVVTVLAHLACQVIFGRTSVLEAISVLSNESCCCVVAMAGLEPAT